MSGVGNLPKELSDALDKLHSLIILNDAPQVEAFLKASNGKVAAQIINEIDDDGFAAVHRAVRKPEQLPVLLTLIRVCTTLNVGIDLDVLGADRETAFFMAVHSDNIRAATALLEAGSKAINTMCGPAEAKKEAPLHIAAKFGYEDMTTFLLQNRAEINARDAWRQTPLVVAAKNNKPTIVYILLMAGANPIPQDVDGKDALYVASENRHTHCVTLLKSEKRYLNDAMSHVRAELKIAKPSLHSSEQLIQMLKVRKEKEEEDERHAMELLLVPPKNKNGGAEQPQPASQQASQQPQQQSDVKANGKKQSSPTTAISAPPAIVSSTSSSSNKENSSSSSSTSSATPTQPQPQPQPQPQQQQKELVSATATAPAPATFTHVPPMSIRTHDPLTGKKLPPCKTLEEVGPTSPPAVPREIANKPPPREATERIGATVMVVGAGLPDDVKEATTNKKNRPMMFVAGNDEDGIVGSIPYS